MAQFKGKNTGTKPVSSKKPVGAHGTSAPITTANKPVTVATATQSRPTTHSTLETKPTKSEIRRQDIAEAAYYLWLQRGGSDISNWLEAERILRATSTR
jgi:hypothetical protein